MWLQHEGAIPDYQRGVQANYIYNDQSAGLTWPDYDVSLENIGYPPHSAPPGIHYWPFLWVFFFEESLLLKHIQKSG